MSLLFLLLIAFVLALARADRLVSIPNDVNTPLRCPETQHGATCSKLWLAAHNGTKHDVAALLRGGADVSQRNADEQTPLHAAAERGSTKIIEKLLASGASIDAADRPGATPLLRATTSGHAAAVQTLLKHGASVDKPTVAGETPLAVAAESDAPDAGIVCALLEHGANQSRVSGRSELRLKEHINNKLCG